MTRSSVPVTTPRRPPSSRSPDPSQAAGDQGEHQEDHQSTSTPTGKMPISDSNAAALREPRREHPQEVPGRAAGLGQRKADRIQRRGGEGAGRNGLGFDARPEHALGVAVQGPGRPRLPRSVEVDGRGDPLPAAGGRQATDLLQPRQLGATVHRATVVWPMTRPERAGQQDPVQRRPPRRGSGSRRCGRISTSRRGPSGPSSRRRSEDEAGPPGDGLSQQAFGGHRGDDLPGDDARRELRHHRR